MTTNPPSRTSTPGVHQTSDVYYSKHGCLELGLKVLYKYCTAIIIRPYRMHPVHKMHAYCCLRFSYFRTKPIDWLGRTSLK